MGFRSTTKGPAVVVHIPPVTVMDDETLMKHLELRHEDGLLMRFLPEPDRAERRMKSPKEWRTYHETMHRISDTPYDHEHNVE
jgi:hypothetical protein